ncbi:MAG TPA: FAD-binding protein [Pseudonocardiaceae bacterium]|nr:FAD-binding protein [Pseudonocardiaceae bacterium]
MNQLAAQVDGPVFTADTPGYQDETAGFQTGTRREPDLVVGATSAADVSAAVRYAAAHDLPVGVQGSGHVLATLTGGVLVTTSRLADVRVDADARTARFGAGVAWAEVTRRTVPQGLAPLSGSAPGVCAVSYLLGGGIGMMVRKYGFAADHVRALDVVTADGEIRHVTDSEDGDLFWALRGGQDNFGIVTAAEVDLMPEPRIYGGGLFFDATRYGERALTSWRQWTADQPLEMTGSLAMVPFPDSPAVPEPLRGKHVVHIRIAYAGHPADGERLTEPLRGIGPRLLDHVHDMPYTESGSISQHPTDPMPYHGSGVMLTDIDDEFLRVLLDQVGPGAEHRLIVELRHLGGAVARPAKVPNAVGHRDARFACGMLSRLGPVDAETAEQSQTQLATALRPWTAGLCLNFTEGVRTPEEISTAYDVAGYRRLTELKARYDPRNMFRLNYNIPPATC